jgi:hypothetical protein
VGGNEICQRNVDPSPEICDGLDNDCDGVIDDGFDFENDPDHCGDCSTVCTAADPTTCGQNGTCANRTCQLYGPETVCRPASCSNGMLTQQATCTGTGACPDEVTVSCAPGTCVNSRDGASCSLDCQTDDQCSADGWCDGGKVCKFKQANGASCNRDRQCTSGFCTDSVCCDSASCDDGIACTADTCATGTCTHVADDSLCEPGQTCDPQQGGCV